MELIDKSALIAEIEKLKEENKPNSKSISEYIKGGIYGFDLAIEKTLGILDTLEIKKEDYAPMDNDFERDAVNFCLDNGLNTTPRIAKTIAKHFFGLGLKVNKSLTWEDIANINEIVCEILKEGTENILYDTQEDFCKEVLKRFKAQK